jgi:hypothetical protein
MSVQLTQLDAEIVLYNFMATFCTDGVSRSIYTRIHEFLD